MGEHGAGASARGAAVSSLPTSSSANGCSQGRCLHNVVALLLPLGAVLLLRGAPSIPPASTPTPTPPSRAASSTAAIHQAPPRRRATGRRRNACNAHGGAQRCQEGCGVCISAGEGGGVCAGSGEGRGASAGTVQWAVSPAHLWRSGTPPVPRGHTCGGCHTRRRHAGQLSWRVAQVVENGSVRAAATGQGEEGNVAEGEEVTAGASAG